MKTLVLLASLAVAHAQFLTPTVSSPFAYPGNTISLSVLFTDSVPSSSITGLQWCLTLPAGFTAGVPQAGPVITGATVFCSGTNCTCLLINTLPTVIQSGVVATIPVLIASTVAPGTYILPIAAATGTNATGTPPAIPISAPIQAQIIVGAGPAGSTTPWFSASVAGVTCKVSKVAQVPMRITWLCDDTYGAHAGSYTADAVNGGNGTNYFYLGLNSIQYQAYTAANLSCLVQINSTPAAQMMLNGLSVPAYSAEYSCSGYSTSGQGVVNWP